MNQLGARIGLALSGGGFRATLFHLGVVRFLFEIGALKHVSRVSAVSGGSILGAHLVLNWERYTSSNNEFEAAANELIAFVQRDIRGRILRRWICQSAFKFDPSSASNFGSDSLLMKFKRRLALVSQGNQRDAASPATVGPDPSWV
jgi:predicted acylesterase/phospholipase RssA